MEPRTFGEDQEMIRREWSFNGKAAYTERRQSIQIVCCPVCISGVEAHMQQIGTLYLFFNMDHKDFRLEKENVTIHWN